jgi:hypothetical protein
MPVETTVSGSVFSRLGGYGFIHHRSLNDPEALEDALAVAARRPQYVHVLEGDLCWDFEACRRLFYFRHPRRVCDTLEAPAIEAGLASGTLMGLEPLARLAATGVHVVIELKVGRGDRARALEHLLDALDRTLPGRYWIDGFSVSLLRLVKTIRPAATVTLHTEYVSRGRLLAWAPQRPLLGYPRISDLDFIDGIAIRRRGKDTFMARAAADVHAAGKALVISRIHTLDHFARSREWGAAAGYVHGDLDPLFEWSDRFDACNGASGAEPGRGSPRGAA